MLCCPVDSNSPLNSSRRGLGSRGDAVEEGIPVAVYSVEVAAGTMPVSEDGSVAEATDGSNGVGEPIIQTFRVAVASGST